VYVRRPFRSEDREAIQAVMREHGFAMLITAAGGEPHASQLPFLLEADEGEGHGTLIGHMARGNPQWRDFASGQEALVVFQGPHHYVSPAWYGAPGEYVPTWNYVIVQARGVPSVVEDDEASFAVARDTVAHYESFRAEPWDLEESLERARRLAPGVVAFRLPIATIEASFKLSQDKPPEVRARVIAALEREAPDAAGLAEAMRRF